jgi:hypothetical protein
MDLSFPIRFSATGLLVVGENFRRPGFTFRHKIDWFGGVENDNPAPGILKKGENS